MSESSREYAEALFMLSRENNSAKEYEDALDAVSEIFSENPEYVELLASPVLSKNERQDVFKEAFYGKIPETVFSFIMMLCDNGHIKEYKACFKEYKALNRSLNEETVATVISAVDLTETEKESLIKRISKISNKTVIPRYIIDESILGGVIIKVDGKIIDGSLKHRLREVREVIEK